MPSGSVVSDHTAHGQSLLTCRFRSNITQVKDVLNTVHTQCRTGDYITSIRNSNSNRPLIEFDLAVCILNSQFNLLCIKRTYIVLSRQIHTNRIIIITCANYDDTKPTCIRVIQYQVGAGNSLLALRSRDSKEHRNMIYITVLSKDPTFQVDITIVIRNNAVCLFSLQVVHKRVGQVHIFRTEFTCSGTFSSYGERKCYIHRVVLRMQLTHILCKNRLAHHLLEVHLNRIASDDERSLLVSQGVVVAQRVSKSCINVNQLLLLICNQRLRQRCRCIHGFVTERIFLVRIVRQHVSQRIRMIQFQLLRTLCYDNVEVVDVSVRVIETNIHIVVSRIVLLCIINNLDVVVLVLSLRRTESDSRTLSSLQALSRGLESLKCFGSFNCLQRLQSLSMLGFTQDLSRSCTYAQYHSQSAKNREKFLHNSFCFWLIMFIFALNFSRNVSF